MKNIDDVLKCHEEHMKLLDTIKELAGWLHNAAHELRSELRSGFCECFTVCGVEFILEYGVVVDFYGNRARPGLNPRFLTYGRPDGWGACKRWEYDI